MDSLYKWMSVYTLAFFDHTARIRLDTIGSSNGLLSLCLAFTYQLLVPPKFIPALDTASSVGQTSLRSAGTH